MRHSQIRTIGNWFGTGALVAFATVATVGCGDDGSGGSGATDAAPVDADPLAPDAGFNAGACPTNFGPTGVAETFVVPDGTVGFDLNGDNSIDNAIGANDTIRILVNNSLGSSQTDGSLRQLSELRDLDSLGADDSNVTVVLYGGIDSDTPASDVDDYTGDEDYYFSRDWVEPEDCAAKAALAGSFTNGVVTASADRTTFFIATLGGFVEFRKAKIEAALEADTKGAKSSAGSPAIFGGAIPGCSLNKAAGQITQSLQQDLAQFAVQPDIDLDGDGLETLTIDNGLICHDGDGTVIDTPNCGCDPRMADGYSITFQLEIVGAGVLGPQPL